MSKSNKMSEPVTITVNTRGDYAMNNRKDRYHNIVDKSDSSIHFIIETNEKLQNENTNLRLRIQKLEDKITRINLENSKNKEIIESNNNKITENLEDDIEKMENQIRCLRGWLHNLHFMKDTTEKANKKYNEINTEILDFYKKSNDNINILKNLFTNIFYFIIVFNIVIYLCNLTTFTTIMQFILLQTVYIGSIGFVVKLNIDKNNLLMDIKNYDKNMLKYKNKIEQIKNS